MLWNKATVLLYTTLAVITTNVSRFEHGLIESPTFDRKRIAILDLLSQALFPCASHAERIQAVHPDYATSS